MILILIASARAEPMHGALLAGWSGTTVHSYSYLTAQPTLLRAGPVKLLARATVSQLHLTGHDGTEVTEVDSPGLSLGPAVAFTPGELALVLGAGAVARHSRTRAGEVVHDRQLSLDLSLSGNLYWRPAQRASISTQVTLGATSETLWARSGATFPVLPAERPVSLWLGLEATSSGPLSSLVTQVGPVVEIPVRPLRASVGLHAATPVSDLVGSRFALENTTLGVDACWSY
jgi:hypothetical protein